MSTGGEDSHLLAVPPVSSIVYKMRNEDCRHRGTTQTDRVEREPPLSGRGISNADKYRRPTVLQLNVEGISLGKLAVVEQLAYKHRASVILLQETHCTSADKLAIPNYLLAGSTLSRKYGLATFVHKSLKWNSISQSPPGAEIEWLCVDVRNYNIANVYKPPRSRMTSTSLPTFPAPSLYAGDFNCQHVDWGYNTTNSDGECLAAWASNNNMSLLFSPKDAASFLSGRWGTETNPDLAFASFDSQHPDRRVLEKFPRSQHRPSLITAPKLGAPVPSRPMKRWNFRKADWNHYSLLTDESATDLLPADSTNVDEAYQDFCNAITSAAKKTIPRGRRRNYTPCWDSECEKLYRSFLQAPSGTASNQAGATLLARINAKRLERWTEAVSTIDFTHSSRKAWSTINNLTGRSVRYHRPCPISANAIAAQLVKNGKYEVKDRKSSRLVAKEVTDLWRVDTPAGRSISNDFSSEEFAAALQQTRPHKSPGPDKICPELILHAGPAMKSWLRRFLSSCLCHHRIPKIWRRASVVAIPKPGKPLDDPKSYRPISLLCVAFKILERLIYARIEPIIDPLLPREQAGFRHGKSTVDQVTLMTQDIEDTFEAKMKAGAVFLDLTAAYDTVWHRGLTCKLLRLLPDRHMVRMIMELVHNRSFTLTTGNGRYSRLRRLRNGVPQGSVLAPLLFNIYTHDLPSTISGKYAYADDLAIVHSAKRWDTLEETLSQDMTILSSYLQNWRLKLSKAKTMSAAFHLNNMEARRELRITVNGAPLPFCPEPKYLGVTLDRSLTYRRHLESLRKKLTSRIALIRRLTGTSWGAGAATLRTAALALVYSTAEYCAPVWCRSAHAHHVDTAINSALRTVTGCLRSTPVENLPVLAGIQPTKLRREGATLSLARRATEHSHLLHHKLFAPSTLEQCRRLKSRHSFVPAAQLLLKHASNLDVNATHWADHNWSVEWKKNSTRLHTFISDVDSHPTGMSLPRRAWVRLNRLRTGVGRFRSSMHKWGMAPSAICECDMENQTADHVISDCPIYSAPNGAQGLRNLDDSTIQWLLNKCPEI